MEVGVFQRGVGHFERRFQREGVSATNHSWCQINRVIALSCGIKNICSVSFSFVTIHACDRQTDGRTGRITTPKTALAYARAVKNNPTVYDFIHNKITTRIE